MKYLSYHFFIFLGHFLSIIYRVSPSTSAGVRAGTPKGTEVRKPGHLVGVDVNQWVRFGLGELGGTG